jgi:hypothetical protein
LTIYALVVSVSVVYAFDASIVKISGDRYVIYPPKEYQEKLKKYHGKKAKVLVVIDSN